MVTENACGLASIELMRWSPGVSQHSNLYLSTYLAKQAASSVNYTLKPPFKSLSDTLNPVLF